MWSHLQTFDEEFGLHAEKDIGSRYRVSRYGGIVGTFQSFCIAYKRRLREGICLCIILEERRETKCLYGVLVFEGCRL
jgi:hypothetical protein